MLSEAVIEVLHSIAGDNVKINEPLKEHTTFKIGGAADAFVEISDASQIVDIENFLRKVDIPYFIFGRGSNILAADKGVRGVILCLGDKFSDVTVDGEFIYAKAGASLAKIARIAMENSLTGMEFAAGIPGCAGGAAVMNAGAYGSEMKDVIAEVTVLSADGEEMVLSNSTMEFGYRTSSIKNRNFCVTGVKYKLTPGDKDEIKNKMDELAEKRRTKQPLEYPSAGSVFKRPEGHFAGALIQEAGFAGKNIGGAEVSSKHCGFIVNKGGATAEDVRNLIADIRTTVKELYSVDLETEIVMIGEY